MPQRERGRGKGKKGLKITIWRWPLPKDVRGALGEYQENPKGLLNRGPDNPALLLQRYVAFSISGEKRRNDPRSKEEFIQYLFEEKLGDWRWEKGEKNKFWKALEERLRELYRPKGGDGWTVGNALEALHRRQEEIERVLGAQGYKFGELDVEVAWRLIVGLGLPSPLETGITLHHLYGFPYLPGSAIKGVTRGWKLQRTADKLGIPRFNAEEYERWRKEEYSPTPWECLEQLLMSPVPRESEKKETREKLQRAIVSRLRELHDAVKTALQENFMPNASEPKLFSLSLEKQESMEQLVREYIEKFSRAFGSTEAKGEVIFFDAYPKGLTVEDKPILELDVMTPHYSEYYAGDKPPADWLTPKPVQFLVVRRKTEFRIYLACRDSGLLKEVKGWVKGALKDFGIGAKTRAGYGELKVSSKAETPPQKVRAPLAVSLAIERWTPRDAGSLPQIVEQLLAVPDLESRRRLARQLQQRLKQAGRWGGRYREKKWHKIIEEILEQEA